MSTQVIATARLDATRRHELYEQFRLGVDPASELGRLKTIVGSRQLSLPDLRQLISMPSASSVLSTLAPAEFGRVRAHMNSTNIALNLFELLSSVLRNKLVKLRTALPSLKTNWLSPISIFNPLNL